MLKDINLKTNYRTDRDDAVENFYAPCILQSVKYSRAVGYFRSSIFLITGESVIDFVRRGGSIRLICSPSMTVEDIKVITEAHANFNDKIIETVISDVERMLERAPDNYSLVVLATLIKIGALEIKIAIRSSGSGIYHEKLGVFQDEDLNYVTFTGSSNETLNAWHPDGNFESIEVFCSWKGEREEQRIERHIRDFEDLWSGRALGIDTIELPDAIKNRILTIHT